MTQHAVAAVNMASVYIAALVAIPLAAMISWVAFLIHRSDQNEVVKFRRLLPSLFPWTAQARLRRKRAELALVRVESDLFDSQFERLQKEMIYHDLEDTRFTRALGNGSSNEQKEEIHGPR